MRNYSDIDDIKKKKNVLKRSDFWRRVFSIILETALYVAAFVAIPALIYFITGTVFVCPEDTRENILLVIVSVELLVIILCDGGFFYYLSDFISDIVLFIEEIVGHLVPSASMHYIFSHAYLPLTDAEILNNAEDLDTSMNLLDEFLPNGYCFSENDRYCQKLLKERCDIVEEHFYRSCRLFNINPGEVDDEHLRELLHRSGFRDWISNHSKRVNDDEGGVLLRESYYSIVEAGGE